VNEINEWEYRPRIHSINKYEFPQNRLFVHVSCFAFSYYVNWNYKEEVIHAAHGEYFQEYAGLSNNARSETIVQYVSAYAAILPLRKNIIGRDGRITGKNISTLISSVLLQAGCDVVDLGVCPTPSVALAVERQKASGGIAVTASHNPMQWNGLKFFAPTGLFLDAEENKIFWNLAKNSVPHYAPWDRQGSYLLTEDFIDEHVGAVLSLPFSFKRILYGKENSESS